MLLRDRCLILPTLALVLAACAPEPTQPTAAPTIARVTASPIATTTTAPTDIEAVEAPTETAEATVTPTETPEPPPSVSASTPDSSQLSMDQFALQEVVGGLTRPVVLAYAEDDADRMFVVEQRGLIWVLREGELLDEPYLDLQDRVTDAANEQGLLGLAFSPDFAQSGRLYVYYTSEDGGKNTISRFQADPAADVADPDSEQILLAVDDPYGNHNGGDILFGPDGYLYAGFGDGGAAGDPEDRAQNLDELLGKIVRLDVSGDEIAIPPDNPFAQGGGRPEIWIYGVRNPWRFSFDRATGDLWIGDVGQNEIEEVSYLPAGQAAGRNLGWRAYEGSERYTDTAYPNEDPVFPVLEYRHSQGCSVTGGYVYRGQALPALTGAYFYGDFCSGNVWAAWTEDDGATWENRLFGNSGISISSFAQDRAGELYLIDHGGVIYKLVAR